MIVDSSFCSSPPVQIPQCLKKGRSQCPLKSEFGNLLKTSLPAKMTGQTAVLAEELREAIRIRVVHLRAKSGLIPLGPCSLGNEPFLCTERPCFLFAPPLYLGFCCFGHAFALVGSRPHLNFGTYSWRMLTLVRQRLERRINFALSGLSNGPNSPGKGLGLFLAGILPE